MSTSTADPIAVPRPEAARLVGLSDKELKRAIDDGELEAHWRGRKCLVDFADLQAWFKGLPPHPPAA